MGISAEYYRPKLMIFLSLISLVAATVLIKIIEHFYFPGETIMGACFSCCRSKKKKVDGKETKRLLESGRLEDRNSPDSEVDISLHSSLGSFANSTVSGAGASGHPGNSDSLSVDQRNIKELSSKLSMISAESTLVDESMLSKQQQSYRLVVELEQRNQKLTNDLEVLHTSLSNLKEEKQKLSLQSQQMERQLAAEKSTVAKLVHEDLKSLHDQVAELSSKLLHEQEQRIQLEKKKAEELEALTLRHQETINSLKAELLQQIQKQKSLTEESLSTKSSIVSQSVTTGLSNNNNNNNVSDGSVDGRRKSSAAGGDDENEFGDSNTSLIQGDSGEALVSEDQEQQLLQKRNNILQEFLETEYTYVENLRILQEHFATPLTDILSKATHEAIFSRIVVIFTINEMFLKDLLNITKLSSANLIQNKVSLVRKDPKDYEMEMKLGERLLYMSQSFKLYSMYILHYEEAINLVKEEMKTNEKFAKYLKQVGKVLKEQLNHRILEITSFLILPVQRLPRYLLLLDDLFKRFPLEEDPDQNRVRSKLLDARSAIADVTEKIDEKQSEQTNISKLIRINSKLKIKNLIQPDRLYIKGCDSVRELKHGGEVKLGRALYLFNDLIVLHSKGKTKLLGQPQNKVYEIPLSDVQRFEQGSSVEKFANVGLKIQTKSKTYEVLFGSEDERNIWFDACEQQKLLIPLY